MSKLKDLTGQRFGRLQVIRREGSANKYATWFCQCDCGNTCIAKGVYLINGDTKSCGCLKRDAISKVGKANRNPNKYEIDGNIIKVYFNASDKYFICDKEDEQYVVKYTWHLANTGYVRTLTSEGKRIQFHNLIVPAENGIVCDHINGNKLDNRRCNLRAVSCQQNNLNHRAYKTNNSGHVGVRFNQKLNKWEAYINKDKQTHYLGVYNLFDDAARAREDAEREYFGEFRRGA